MNKLTAIILTHNSESMIAKVVNSCKNISDRMIVVDDFSEDKTVRIAKSLGCEVVQHKFENYSKQRNWAQEYAGLNAGNWFLHLDSDEVITKKLASNISNAIKSRGYDGYLLKRRTYFMGRPIRFGHLNPNWHLRVYKAGKGFCEHRLYDQHFVIEGKTKRLSGLMLDMQDVPLSDWVKSHNRWAKEEAKEILFKLKNEKQLPEKLKGDPRMRKRWIKNRVYYKLPILLRPFLFFAYSYFFRLGFLDGGIGFAYSILHAFWFRFLVDVNILEMKLKVK